MLQRASRLGLHRPSFAPALAFLVLASGDALATGGEAEEEASAILFRRGDADGSGAVNLSDAVYELNALFLGGTRLPCADAADANDDGLINLTDAVHVLNFLFLGGAPIAPPGPQTCGEDSRPDGLGCATYSACSPPESVRLAGRTVAANGTPLMGATVAVSQISTLSTADGSFLLENVRSAPALEVTASRGPLAGSRLVEVDLSAGDLVRVGDIFLTDPTPPPDECGNVVARAAERGCGRVFVWGDEHVKFDEYFPASGSFWNRAMDWLSEPSCGGGRRVRVGDFPGALHERVVSLLRARGMTVERVSSLDDLDGFDIVVAQAHWFLEHRPVGLRQWVEDGGALMTLVSGLGDSHWMDCFQANEIITDLGLEYDCNHAAPWGPVTELEEHPIGAGLGLESAPFVNGRWVVDVGGMESRVVARSGDDCSPREIAAYDCRTPPGFGEPPPAGGNLTVELTCEYGGAADTEPPSSGTELNIIGLYESTHGEVSVRVDRRQPMVLVLSAYGSCNDDPPIHWNVEMGPGAAIEKVILNSYEDQTVTVPEGVPVETRSISLGNWLGAGYGDDCGGGDTPALIAGAEAATGLAMRSFHGCYSASSVTFPE